MGWVQRLLGRSAAPAEPAPAEVFSDLGVPDLAEPVHARALVLAEHRRTATVDVEPPGRETFRAELRSATPEGSFSGLVMRWHVPVLYAAQHPDVVHLVEPPCGPDLPLVPDELREVREVRDLRTAALLARYPLPSAAQLAVQMAPTASQVHPAWDAVCYRIGLMTTAEAQAVLDGIRADGNAWDRTVASLYSWGPDVPDDRRKLIGRYVAHLGHVAPQGREIEQGPFWTLGVATLMRDLSPSEVDTSVFERVMRPFVEVCGPLPDALL